MDRKQMMDALHQHKIVAILRGVPEAKVVKTAQALAEGGIRMMEVTFPQEDPAGEVETLSSIRQLCAQLHGSIHVGAGTVLTKRQAEAAHQAGASFIVTPNTDPELITYAVSLGLSVFPGAFTPTEIVAAYCAGASAVKVFPAGVLGPGYIKAVRAPLAHIPLIAVGNVDADNMGSVLAAGVMAVGLGGSLVDRRMIAVEDYGALAQLAEVYVKALINE